MTNTSTNRMPTRHSLTITHHNRLRNHIRNNRLLTHHHLQRTIRRIRPLLHIPLTILRHGNHSLTNRRTPTHFISHTRALQPHHSHHNQGTKPNRPFNRFNLNSHLQVISRRITARIIRRHHNISTLRNITIRPTTRRKVRNLTTSTLLSHTRRPNPLIMKGTQRNHVKIRTLLLQRRQLRMKNRQPRLIRRLNLTSLLLRSHHINTMRHLSSTILSMSNRTLIRPRIHPTKVNRRITKPQIHRFIHSRHSRQTITNSRNQHSRKRTQILRPTMQGQQQRRRRIMATPTVQPMRQFNSFSRTLNINRLNNNKLRPLQLNMSNRTQTSLTHIRFTSHSHRRMQKSQLQRTRIPNTNFQPLKILHTRRRPRSLKDNSPNTMQRTRHKQILRQRPQTHISHLQLTRRRKVTTKRHLPQPRPLRAQNHKVNHMISSRTHQLTQHTSPRQLPRRQITHTRHVTRHNPHPIHNTTFSTQSRRITHIRRRFTHHEVGPDRLRINRTLRPSYLRISHRIRIRTNRTRLIRINITIQVTNNNNRNNRHRNSNNGRSSRKYQVSHNVQVGSTHQYKSQPYHSSNHTDQHTQDQHQQTYPPTSPNQSNNKSAQQNDND